MRKTAAFMLSICMAAAWMTGCGSSQSQNGGADTGKESKASADSAAAKEDTGSAKPDSGSEGDPVVLDMMWWTDGSETVVMQELIDEYQQLNPNITINLQEIAFDDLTTKLQMAIAGGEAPALSRCTESTISQLHGAMINFADYVDGEELKAQYLDSVDYLYMSGDQICAIPTEVTANGMIYNKTAFEQAGVSVPSGPDDIWTWDEFKEALKKVVDNSDVQYGMVIDNASHRWCTMLYEFGGSMATEAGGNLSSEESLNAIKFTKDLFDSGLAVSSIWLSGEDPNNLFRSGQVAVHISGTWMMQNYDENIKDFQWGVTYMPTGTTRSSVPGGKAITVFNGTGVEQEAVDFATWVTAKEQNEKYCKDSLFVSPRVDNANIEYAVRSEEFAVFADELANTVSAAGFDFSMPGYTAVGYTALQSLWPEVLTGALTPEEMAAEIDEKTNEFMKENNYLK